MRTVVSDVECNGFADSTKMWLFGGIDVATGERYQFEPFRGEKERKDAVKWAKEVKTWIGHSFISYDTEQVNRLVEPDLINPHSVIDTLVISRLICFDRRVPPGCKSGHSLKAHGIRLGIHKGDFNKFDEYSDEMVEYWQGDLDVTMALYEDFKKYIYDPEWKKSMRCEHDLQIALEKQKFYGFHFDKDKASDLLVSVKKKMDTLEAGFAEDFPPQLKIVKTLNYNLRKDGTEGVHVTRAKEEHPLTKVDGDSLLCYDYIPFKPGSPVDRVDVLWEAGWKPFEKTKTHNNFARKKVGDPYGKSVRRMSQEFYDKKQAHLERYGWTCSEDNLATLPKDAPEGAKNLAQWLTLEGRRSSLVEWIGQVKSDGRIHGSVMGIGAWTQRCAHIAPNTANIASAWPTKDGVPVEPKNAVEEIKHEYDTAMRGLWGVPEDKYLLGTDASGIQLRILAHYTKSQQYVDAIVSGKSEDETDIHNLNRKALGIEHVTRDMAKTFIYAFLLGAGIPKVASILKVSNKRAGQAVSDFTNNIEGLAKLKKEVIPFVAKRGWFTGFDGRKVIVPNEHKTLAGFLQNGEAVIMKHWILKWQKEADELGLKYKMVGFIHDEVQCEVDDLETVEALTTLQKKCMVEVGGELGVFCPLDSESSYGTNWANSH